MVLIPCYLIGFHSIPWKENLLSLAFGYASLLFLQVPLLCFLPQELLGTQWGNLLVNIIVLSCAVILNALNSRFHFSDIIHQYKPMTYYALGCLFLPELVFAQLFMISVVHNRSVSMIIILLLQALYLSVIIAVMLIWQHRLGQKELHATQKYISALNDHLNVSRQQAHDFHKHLLYFRQTANTIPDIEELKNSINSYCDDLIESYDDTSILLQLDSPIFRALLYGRQTQAAQNGIQLYLNASPLLPDFPLKSYQLVTVFDNLVDNAFECVTEMPEEKRWIRITLEAAASTDRLIIENPYETLDISTLINEKHFTSKAGNHQGIGLQTVSEIIERTGGKFVISNQNHVFAAKVIYNH